MGCRDIPQYRPKHPGTEMFYSPFSGGHRPRLIILLGRGLHHVLNQSVEHLLTRSLWNRLRGPFAYLGGRAPISASDGGPAGDTSLVRSTREAFGAQPCCAAPSEEESAIPFGPFVYARFEISPRTIPIARAMRVKRPASTMFGSISAFVIASSGVAPLLSASSKPLPAVPRS